MMNIFQFNCINLNLLILSELEWHLYRDIEGSYALAPNPSIFLLTSGMQSTTLP